MKNIYPFHTGKRVFSPKANEYLPENAALATRLKLPGLLLGVLLQLFCFKLNAQTMCDSDACFSAYVNNTSFQFREDWPFTARLIEHQGSLDGSRPARKVINIMLEGNSYALDNNNWFTDGIQFEIAYNGQVPDSSTLCTVELQYTGTVYGFIKGLGKLVVTKFEWKPDHRSFTLSYDYDFVMRSWGYPSSGKPDVKLSGSVNHVSIEVPGWMVAKN